MYASGSMTHSSPMTAVSSIRARRITSVFLPTTQPRRVTPWPTKTRLCTTARCTPPPPLPPPGGPHPALPARGPARLDLRVLADRDRAGQHRVRVHLGALGDPHAGRELEPSDIGVDLAVEHVRLR